MLCLGGTLYRYDELTGAQSKNARGAFNSPLCTAPTASNSITIIYDYVPFD